MPFHDALNAAAWRTRDRCCSRRRAPSSPLGAALTVLENRSASLTGFDNQSRPTLAVKSCLEGDYCNGRDESKAR